MKFDYDLIRNHVHGYKLFLVVLFQVFVKDFTKKSYIYIYIYHDSPFY